MSSSRDSFLNLLKSRDYDFFFLFLTFPMTPATKMDIF